MYYLFTEILDYEEVKVSPVKEISGLSLAKISKDPILALEETKINPRLLPRIIRSIANVAYGTKTGRIKVFMESGVITHVFGEERDNLNLDALDEERD